MLLKSKQQKFSAQLLNDDLFYIKYNEGQELNEFDLEKSHDCFLELAQGQPIKSLIEIGKNSFISPNVKSCGNTNGLRSRAKAIVTDSLPIRLAVNQNLYADKVSQNTKVFKIKRIALKWLASVN